MAHRNLSQNRNERRNKEVQKVGEEEASHYVSPSSLRGLKISPHELYKTALCVKWVDENQTCPYGDTCSFAHGVEELREPPRRVPDQYKTQMCALFHSEGWCPYGSRCHFIHPSDQIEPKDRESHIRRLEDQGFTEKIKKKTRFRSESLIRRCYLTQQAAQQYHQNHHPNNAPANTHLYYPPPNYVSLAGRVGYPHHHHPSSPYPPLAAPASTYAQPIHRHSRSLDPPPPSSSSSSTTSSLLPSPPSPPSPSSPETHSSGGSPPPSPPLESSESDESRRSRSSSSESAPPSDHLPAPTTTTHATVPTHAHSHAHYPNPYSSYPHPSSAAAQPPYPAYPYPSYQGYHHPPPPMYAPHPQYAATHPTQSTQAAQKATVKPTVKPTVKLSPAAKSFVPSNLSNE